MPPKRTVAGAENSQSPRKRAKKTASSPQKSIESFFSKGIKDTTAQSNKKKGSHPQQSSSPKPREDVIVIDDSENDRDSGLDSKSVNSNPAATPVQYGTTLPLDVGIASFSTRSSGSNAHSGGTHSTGGRPDGHTMIPEDAVKPVHVTGEGNIPSITSNTSLSKGMLGRLTVDQPRASASGSGLTLSAILPFPDLTIDPLLFEPYVDRDHSPWWPEGTSAPYALLVHALQALTSTRSRISILSILTNVLRVLIVHDPPSVQPALYLLSNSLSPPWEGIELGAGVGVVSKALQSTTSITPATMRTLYKQHGDPGDVAYHAVVGNVSAPRTSVLRPHPPLLIQALYQELRKIASAKGEGSQKLRQAIIERLMLSAVGSSWKSGKSSSYTDLNPHLLGEEPRYLVRTLVHNLRVGAVRTTILSALARAVTLAPSRGVTTLDDAAPSRLDASDLAVVKETLVAQEHSKPMQSRKSQSSTKKGQNAAFTEAYERVQSVLKHADGILRQAFAQHPSYDDIVTVLLEHGIEGVLSPSSAARLTLGIPLLPTLGSPMRSLEDIYELLGPQAAWCAEKKYDGQRAQVHAWREGNTFHVRIFSRHLENMTDKYPDLVHLITSRMQADISLNSFIADAEAVAVDPLTGDLRSFQELAGRARKDVQIGDVKVAVCLFIFDMMLLNGDVLIQKSFRERRRLLHAHLPSTMSTLAASGDEGASTKHVRATLAHVESIDAQEGRDAVQEFWERAVESKCEGLMIKLLDDAMVIVEDGDEVDNDDELNLETSPTRSTKRNAKKGRRKALPATYEPDKRTSAWLKLKKDYVEGIGDSLDLVPIGAWHGNGRKAAWWSPLLLGVYDPEHGIFVAMCKCMSGFTDAFYKGLKERYSVDSDTCSTTSRWNVETGGYRPSVYFKPLEVWEIRGADLSISPTSVTALGLLPQAREKGLSLRFPRFIRLRSDKSIEMASTPAFVCQLWTKQENKGETKGGMDEGDLIDYIEEEETLKDEYESDGDVE